MSTKVKIELLGEHDYLQSELQSDVRHEYVQGYVYAMVGTSKQHSIDSLREYALVAQDKIEIEVYRRESDGWTLEHYTVGDKVVFESIDFTIPIEEIYADVINLP